MSDNQVSLFEKELSALLNRHCAENASNTPDFILASYVNDCLTAFNRASDWRSMWYSKEGVPEQFRRAGLPAVKP